MNVRGSCTAFKSLQRVAFFKINSDFNGVAVSWYWMKLGFVTCGDKAATSDSSSPLKEGPRPITAELAEQL